MNELQAIAELAYKSLDRPRLREWFEETRNGQTPVLPVRPDVVFSPSERELFMKWWKDPDSWDLVRDLVETRVYAEMQV